MAGFAGDADRMALFVGTPINRFGGFVRSS
jgi:hypothetical protein